MTFILAFCRIGGCFLVIPGLSSARVPTQVRVLLVFALVTALAPLIWPHVSAHGNPDNAGMARLVAHETIIGAAMGFASRFMMLALGYGATAIGMSMGFGGLQGPGIEEVEAQASMVTLITMSALALMFTLDFHHDIIKALIGSYLILPVGSELGAEHLLANLVDVLTDSFLIVLRLSSPFIMYAIVMNLLLGLLNKLTPQIPIYFVSLPFVLAGGLLLAYFALPALLSLFAQGFSEVRMLR